ncbi:MAG: hypothetical protein WA633_28920 [Stellaceae bacterium]
MKFIAVAIITTAIAFAAHAESTPDQTARRLGRMEWHASVCHLPTAPLEDALERYIGRIHAGALEADHLRQEMVAGRAEHERLLGSRMNCDGAAAEVATTIEQIDKIGLH